MKPALIPVREWAQQIFGAHAPHPNTLLNWIHGGKISPVPVKVGSRFFCRPDARYVDPRVEDIESMVHGC